MLRFPAVLRRLALLAVFSLLAVACSDTLPTAPGPDVVIPPAADFGMLVSLPAQRADLSGQYVVVLNGKGMGALESKVQKLGGSVLFSHSIGLAVVTGISEKAAAELSKEKAVTEMFQDFRFKLDPPTSPVRTQAAVGTPQTTSDPTLASFYAFQWNMRAIGADEAWAHGRLGSSAVSVAILDTGIDYLYPDLAGRVDLSRSISFVPFDDGWLPLLFPGRHPVTDMNFHGTHVASTAVSNGNVLAGVTSRATLMGVKVCDLFGDCEFWAMLAGVLYAADNGADVINMSLGGSVSKQGEGWYVGLINRVFNYAGSKGATVVVSAGNLGRDLDHDRNSFEVFCSAPNVICVAATGPTASESPFVGPWENVDAPASYTNFGRSAINVAAPGGTGEGPIWGACSQTSLWYECGAGVFVLGLAGTSMAAPHVTGLAALVVEDVGRNPGRVKAAIQRGADDLGQRGTDPFYGKGRINVPGTVRH